MGCLPYWSLQVIGDMSSLLCSFDCSNYANDFDDDDDDDDNSNTEDKNV